MNSIIWELNKRLPLLNVRLKIENFTVPPRAFIRRYYGIYLLLSIFFKRSTFYAYCSMHKMSIDVWSRKLYARWSMHPIQTGLFRAPQNWRGGIFSSFHPPFIYSSSYQITYFVWRLHMTKYWHMQKFWMVTSFWRWHQHFNYWPLSLV